MFENNIGLISVAHFLHVVFICDFPELFVEGFSETWNTVLVVLRLASRYGRKLSMQASTSIRPCLSKGSSICCQ